MRTVGGAAGAPGGVTQGGRTLGALRVALHVTLASTLACASGGSAPATSAGPDPGNVERVNSPWPIATRMHVDLWLHGFAMLQSDTTLIPYFERGYSSSMEAFKRRANVSTQLDLNAEQLRARMAINPSIINAQFLALQASSLDNLLGAAELFLRAEGVASRSGDRATQLAIATFAQYFPTAADREWLRMFLIAIRDENDRFYRSYWLARQQDLSPVLTRVDSLWESHVRPKLQGYLGNSRSGTGTMLLSLPLNGEGRTLTGSTRTNNLIAVGFPDSLSQVDEAFYVFAHEAILRIAQTAVDDNTTPVEKRDGLNDRYLSAAAVRGGLLLLERTLPEMAAGYMRYYLLSAGRPVPATTVRDAFEQTFPLPQQIFDAVESQLASVMGGI
ncbi:MAG TPA: hypothetical protein VMM77_08860 [Gemmatimonadaceae bacterium]|nr:hypothetical protein [Gemmatimonadaceae bacterium]